MGRKAKKQKALTPEQQLAREMAIAMWPLDPKSEVLRKEIDREEQAKLAAPFGKENVRKAETRRMPVVVGGVVHEADIVKTGYYKLWERGTISDSALNSAEAFRVEFERAGYARCKTTNLTGAGGGGMTPEDICLRRALNPNYVHTVINMLGGPRNLMAVAVVQFIGHGETVKAMAADSGKSRDYWSGILVAALQLMGKDYEGMTRGERSRGRLQHSGDRPEKIPG